jgi:protein involved in polysaccharide export with SLBB domain
MKTVNRIVAFAFAATFTVSSVAAVMAQPQDPAGSQTRQRVAEKPVQDPAKAPGKKMSPFPQTGDRLEPDETSIQPGDVPANTQANRHEQLSEEAAVVPYYNNFFNTYRLGPEDVISVNVFGQDRYSRAGITIPPSGRISLQLIPGGVFVNGKTVEEVAEIIKQKYDEYIIEPEVTVSLEKASSYRYSILGDIAQPGIRVMSHRMTVTEAIAEAGGVLPTGSRSNVVVLRRQANGMLAPIAVNVSKIYKGQAPDNTYLVPGDQILVPGNKFKTFQKIMSFASVASFARIFTGGW